MRVYLDSSKMTIKIILQSFLRSNHRYRSKIFFKLHDSKAKNYSTLERPKNGQHVFDMERNIQVVLGKKNLDRTKRDRITPPIPIMPLKKKSMFLKYLPYRANLEVPHAIDGMHLKKNVFKIVIGFFLTISGKSCNTKDGLKTRR